MAGCGLMVAIFGAWLFFGWVFFDPEDWNGGGKRNEEQAAQVVVEGSWIRIFRGPEHSRIDRRKRAQALSASRSNTIRHPY